MSTAHNSPDHRRRISIIEQEIGMGRLDRRVVLVTGAAQGLGRGIAERLAEEGAHLVLTDINEVVGRATAKSLAATFYRQDIASEADWQMLLAEIESGVGALHVLVNNAGIEGDPKAPKDPEHAPLEDWNRIFAVNAAGVFLGCKHA